jgi:hypothetical protein
MQSLRGRVVAQHVAQYGVARVAVATGARAGF